VPGLSVLFWNLNDRPLETRVGRLAVAHAVDVVCLAECNAPAGQLTAALAAAGVLGFAEAEQSGGKLRVLSRFSRRKLAFVQRGQNDRWLIYRVHLDRPAPDVTLAVAHLPSKLHAKPETQAKSARDLAADIRAIEKRRAHRRTVVVGDLNMNPFEEGVISADGLHGMMTVQLAATGSRVIEGQEHTTFYNPMWGLFGDRTPGPPGTYYRSAADAVNYFWNTFDQVLVGPELADRLKTVSVLEHDGTSSLRTANGLPDRSEGSDHLPLLFRLEW
jgi:exonuclease III